MNSGGVDNSLRIERLEDFSTEMLAGILSSNHIWLNEFCIWLGVSGKQIKIHTQKCYTWSKPNDCKVDMVIETEFELAFLEFKVNSGEGDGQLEKYSLLLNRESRNLLKLGRLYYITLTYDPKDASVFNDMPFKQLRWFEIARWIDRYKTDSLIQEFLSFLKHHQMDANNTLNMQDLAAFSRLRNIYMFMTEYFDRLSPVITAYFNSPFKKRTWESELKEYTHFGMRFENCLQGNAYSDFSIRFHFPINETPFLGLGFWLSTGHGAIPKFKEAISTFPNGIEYGEFIGEGFWFSRSIFLTEVIDNSNPPIEILLEKTEGHLRDICQFIANTNESLPWNIKITGKY